jgi:multidrug efflux pump subunit AcrB
MARRTVASNLIMVFLILGGIVAAVNIQKEVYPSFALDSVRVQVSYPGASPVEVEQSILQSIEEAVQSVGGIRELRSSAREGSGVVTVHLVAGTDRMKAFQDVDQAVGSITTFPDDAERPEVSLSSRRRDVLQIMVYGDVDTWQLRQYGQQLRDILLSQEGLTEVVLHRVRDMVLHVEIPQRTLRRYGITLGEMARTLREHSRDIPGGSIESTGGQILLRVQSRR